MPTIIGSHGVLSVDALGIVLSYEPNDTDTPDAYSDIVCIDVQEYVAHYGKLDSHIDILDVGFWTETGDYEAPEPFHREQITAGSQSLCMPNH